MFGYAYLDAIALVITIILALGGAILAFNFKTTRCLARHETNITNIKEQITHVRDQLDKLADTLLTHIDKH